MVDVDIIVLLVAVIMSIGMASVLFYAFRIQDKPKEWNRELGGLYRIKTLRERGVEREDDHNALHNSPDGADSDGAESEQQKQGGPDTGRTTGDTVSVQTGEPVADLQSERSTGS